MAVIAPRMRWDLRMEKGREGFRSSFQCQGEQVHAHPCCQLGSSLLRQRWGNLTIRRDESCCALNPCARTDALVCGSAISQDMGNVSKR